MCVWKFDGGRNQAGSVRCKLRICQTNGFWHMLARLATLMLASLTLPCAVSDAAGGHETIRPDSHWLSYPGGDRTTVVRSLMPRLRPCRSRRPGPPPVPPGVWAEPPAGPCNLILSDPRRLWDGSRAPGRAPRVWNACIRGGNSPQTQRTPTGEVVLVVVLSLTWLPRDRSVAQWQSRTPAVNTHAVMNEASVRWRALVKTRGRPTVTSQAR